MVACARWRHVCRERADAVERLRTCITRRRIAFRVFKQWYWESFDEDVQVRCWAVPLPPAPDALPASSSVSSEVQVQRPWQLRGLTGCHVPVLGQNRRRCVSCTPPRATR